jgi:hypothetical protein
MNHCMCLRWSLYRQSFLQHLMGCCECSGSDESSSGAVCVCVRGLFRRISDDNGTVFTDVHGGAAGGMLRSDAAHK